MKAIEKLMEAHSLAQSCVHEICRAGSNECIGIEATLRKILEIVEQYCEDYAKIETELIEAITEETENAKRRAEALKQSQSDLREIQNSDDWQSKK